MKFWSDFSDHGGEVHDSEALSDLGMAALMGVKVEVQEGESGGSKVSESHSMTDGEESEGAKGKKSVPQSRRKVKVDWTPELHRKFVAAVEQLGVEKAIPSRILNMMGVHCLTRHNIASHLQKYRSHRRHLLSREAEAATWHQHRPMDPAYSKMGRDATCWVPLHPPPHIQLRPSHLGLPPLQPHPPPPHPSTLPPPPSSVGMPLHVWGHPSLDRPPSHMWQQHPPPAWYGPDGALWPFPVQPPMNMWPPPGRPPYPPPPAAPHRLAPASQLDNCFDPEAMAQLCAGLPDDLDLLIDSDGPFALEYEYDESKYILDVAISEALANPSQPLPLGLKPPSIAKVMAELERQGFPTTAQPAILPTLPSE